MIPCKLGESQRGKSGVRSAILQPICRVGNKEFAHALRNKTVRSLRNEAELRSMADIHGYNIPVKIIDISGSK